MSFKKYGLSRNLFDEEYPGYAVGSTIKYRPIYVGQGTFTLSTTFPQMEDYGDLFFLAGNVSTGATTGNDGVWSERPITVESIDGYVTVAYRRFSSSHPSLRDYNTMLNLGSTPLPYEPYGNIWQSINPNQLKGIPYTGTLPAVLAGTKAGYLHRYKIYGNLEQTGTPTPENPIVPSECGERTENLFSGEFSQFDNVGGTGSTYAYFYIPEDFTLTLIAKDTHTIPRNTYLGITKDGGQSTGGFTWAILQGINVTEGEIFTVESSINGYHYVSMYLKAASTLSWILEHYYVMLTAGSTALPYEPYGYKLPLSSAGQDVDIYLGESQTTRQIKKLVFDGTENWSAYNSGASTFFYTSVASSRSSELQYIISSHFVGATISTNNTNVGTQILQTQLRIRPESVAGTTTADFKAYLAQQYANGTPVTVWYVLATEETGVVNEPLRKIGDYADAIDSTQTSAQIPTSANSTTISWAGSGLAPSQFDSIQEWVDIPTYKRVNGEWVADN